MSDRRQRLELTIRENGSTATQRLRDAEATVRRNRDAAERRAREAVERVTSLV